MFHINQTDCYTVYPELLPLYCRRLSHICRRLLAADRYIDSEVILLMLKILVCCSVSIDNYST